MLWQKQNRNNLIIRLFIKDMKVLNTSVTEKKMKKI